MRELREVKLSWHRTASKWQNQIGNISVCFQSLVCSCSQEALTDSLSAALSCAPNSSRPCRGAQAESPQGVRRIIEEPETDRWSGLERTTKMFFKRGSLPWGRKGGIGSVVAKGGLLQCLGALLGSKLSCHPGEDLTKNCSPPNAHRTPIKKLWDLLFSR